MRKMEIGKKEEGARMKEKRRKKRKPYMAPGQKEKRLRE